MPRHIIASSLLPTKAALGTYQPKSACRTSTGPPPSRAAWVGVGHLARRPTSQGHGGKGWSNKHAHTHSTGSETKGRRLKSPESPVDQQEQGSPDRGHGFVPALLPWNNTICTKQYAGFSFPKHGSKRPSLSSNKPHGPGLRLQKRNPENPC